MEISRTYGVATTIYFPLIDFGATDFEATPVTFAAGDTQYSIDGGAFANTGSNPAHEGNGIYSLALTAAEMSGDIIVITLIDQTATKLWEDQSIIIDTGHGAQREANQGIVVLEVDTAVTAATATAFECLRLAPNTTEETTADHYNGRNILFTTGNLLGQMTDITDYALQNSREFYTVTALTEAPADGDRFVVL